ncbi:hypothetical protein OROGR_018172 [Orobanche gracilis]
MRPHFITIFITTSFIFQLTTQAESTCNGDGRNRRILHQPLFPATTPPISPPLPPPPSETPEFPDQDLPFFNERPTGTTTTPYQGQTQPPPLPAIGTAVVTNPVAAHPPYKPTRKIAVALTSVILTLGVLSAMAFYLYKHRLAHSSAEAQKLFDENTQRIINEESRMPTSTFLRTETAEPSTSAASLVIATNAADGSPYRKLNSAKGVGRRSPIPNLQPMAPSAKPPPPPPTGLSYPPPPMSSSDDESQDNSFKYTPRATPDNRISNSIPHSKRTSPKSRFSPSPPIKQSSTPPPSPSTFLGPLQPSKTLNYSPKRAKFSPPPGTGRRLSVSNNDQQISKTTIPHPPPPPPLSITRNNWAVKAVARQMTRPRSKTPSPKSTLRAEDVNKSGSSFDGEDNRERSKPKMKTLHWDKVGTTPDAGTVWDQLKSSSFQLSEDAMESLFGRNSEKSVPKEATRKSVFPSFDQENRILDSKKSQTIAILLRALNVTREEVCDALLDGNPEGLDPELFETLVKMAPNKEEEIKIKKYEDGSSKLGPAERFLRAILDIPFAFKRVEAMLYRANFNTEVEYLRKSFQTLEEASVELKNSRLFLKLLEAVLRTGNRMNDGTNHGSAKAFKLDTLLKLADVKGADGKTTLLHFVVQEIVKSEGINSETPSRKTNLKCNEDDFKKQALRIVSGLSRELGNVKKAASMDSDVLSSYVSKLETGLQKVKQVFEYENQMNRCNFFDSMRVFLKEASDEISRVKAQERKALSLVREATYYFHGDTAKQETQPLRIFMIVRDFLSVMDNVCKDVGRIHDRGTIGAGSSFRIPASLPVLSKYNVANDGSSGGDSM